MMTLLGLVALAALFGLGSRSGSSPTDVSEEELRYLIREASLWVSELRARHRPGARALSPAELRSLEGFFPPAVLKAARVKLVAGLENPPFYRLFDESGRPRPIDFSRMSGMSLQDTVLAVEGRVVVGGSGWLALLFHELVHNTQYHVLGDAGYYESYVHGWAQSGTYRGIPIEEQAYELTGRFRAGERFSVEQEVRRVLTR